MAAFDLPVNDPDLYYLSARSVGSSLASNGNMALAPSSPSGPTTSSSSATASHPDLSTTLPKSKSASTTIANAAIKGTTSNNLISQTGLDNLAANVNQQYASSTSPAALASLGANASPTDIVLTLPPPLLRLLVVAAPFVSTLTTISQLLTWTHPNPFAPFFLPALWAIACLGGEVILRYGLNGLILGLLAISWLRRKGIERRKQAELTAAAASAKNGSNKESVATAPASSRDTTSIRTISAATSTQPAVQVLTPVALNTHMAEAAVLAKYIQVLHRSFSPLLAPFTWKDPNLSWNTIYLLLNSYPLYFLLTYAIPLRHIILVLGLLALFWEAPWFAVVRRSLWKSALVRRTARVCVRVLYGEINFVRHEAMRGQKNVGITTRWSAFRQIWRDTKVDVAAEKQRRASSPGAALDRGRSRSVTDKKGVEKYSSNIVEIHYLFTIFENQRWWIGLEWTQALLPNERPSWSDPTHAPTEPPGSFSLPPPMTVYESATKKRTFTWKWSDSEWRIRGTAGVLISPSTIGANPNPVNPGGSNTGVASGTAAATAASMSDKATKDLKDVMGTLGDWKSMLSNRGSGDDKDKRSSVQAAAPGSGDDKGSTSTSSNAHARKGSNTFFGESFNALIGAKDGKPVLKDTQGGASGTSDGKSADSIDGDAASSSKSSLPPTEDPDLLGHPARLDDAARAADVEAKQWEVDSQGWVYADNHWEKPTSKGGMGRYTRRRAWVRRAIVVEQLEDVDGAEAESARAVTKG